MKKLFPIAVASLLLIACSPKAEKTAEKESSIITWIEDKPGPTLQEQKIFPTVPDSIWEALHLQDGVPSSMSCFLLQTEGETILFDAGLGAPFSQLMPKLKELGVEAEKLRLIYISHLHPDHIGGLLKDGKKVFPNADLYINRIEAEAWKGMDSEQSALPKSIMEAYKDHLCLFEAGDTLKGGIQTMAAYGHTPGHTVFQKDSILIISDLLHGAALQLEHPEFCPFFDMDPEAATEARMRILKYARENNLTMYGMHLPKPGYIK